MFHRKKKRCSDNECSYLNKIILRKSLFRGLELPSNGTKVNLGPTFFSPAWIPAWLAAHRYRGAIGYVYFFLMFAGDGERMGEGRGDGNRFYGRDASRGSRHYRRIFYLLIHALLCLRCFICLSLLSFRGFFLCYRSEGSTCATGFYVSTCCDNN